MTPRRIAVLAVWLAVASGCSPAPPPIPGPVDLQGHRGARGLAPENTIPAFIAGLEAGAGTMELDLAISADSVVVVSHEPYFSARICSWEDGTPVAEAEELGLNIHAMPYDEVARFDCGSRGHPQFPRQTGMPASKPTLAAVVDTVEAWGAVHGMAPKYNVEIKSRPESDGVYHPAPAVFAALVRRVLVDRGIADRTTVQSFDPRALEAVRALDPSLRLALLVDNGDGLDANLGRLSFTPDIYSPHRMLVDRELVDRVHAAGMAIVPWTVNEEDAMRALLRLGIDGLITDYPDLGRAAIDEVFPPGSPPRP